MIILNKEKRRRHKIDRIFKRQAFKVLNGIEPKLSKKDRQLCDAYAIDTLGSVVYAPWLYVYCVISGKFREGWIPDNYFRHYIVDFSSNSQISGQRNLSTIFFGPEYFPDIASFFDGRIFSVNGEVIVKNKVARILFESSDKVIFKSDNSSRGRGIRFFTKDSFDESVLDVIGNGVFQRVIQQHESFNRFTHNSLATLRFTTAIDSNGCVSLRASYLRLGRDQDTYVKANSLVRVAFDGSTGRLLRTGYTPDWNRISKHPDTDSKFDGVELPNIAACVALVKQMHLKFPYVECIGWDLAIDQSGSPQILEWNTGHPDIKFTEATQGPCFRDLDWVSRWHQNRPDSV